MVLSVCLMLLGGGIANAQDWEDGGASPGVFLYKVDLKEGDVAIRMRLEYTGGEIYVVRQFYGKKLPRFEVKTLTEAQSGEWIKSTCGDFAYLSVFRSPGCTVTSVLIDDNKKNWDIQGGFFANLPESCKEVGVYHHNYISREIYEQMFSTLPRRPKGQGYIFFTSLDTHLNDGADKCYTGIAEDKGWDVGFDRDGSPKIYKGEGTDSYYAHYATFVLNGDNISDTYGLLQGHVYITPKKGGEFKVSSMAKDVNEINQDGWVNVSMYFWSTDDQVIIIYGEFEDIATYKPKSGNLNYLLELNRLNTFKSYRMRAWVRDFRVYNCEGLETLSYDYSMKGSYGRVEVIGNPSLEYLNLYDYGAHQSYRPSFEEVVIRDNPELKYAKTRDMAAYNGIMLDGLHIKRAEVANCASAENIWLQNNRLTDLSLSGLPKLNMVKLDGNDQLASLDLSGARNLRVLDVSGLSALTHLDVSGCRALASLKCREVPLTSLNLARCPRLSFLDCSYTNIGSLDLSPCAGSLTSLAISGLKLGPLNLASMPNLQYLECRGSGLSSLNLSDVPKLKKLDCSNNPIGTLDIAQCDGLSELNASNCGLSQLAVDKCPKLFILACEDNGISGTMDVSGLTSLTKFTCQNNKLTGQLRFGSSKLKEVNCSNNSLTSLVLGSKQPKLRTLNLSGNSIGGTFDFSKYPALREVDCSGNSITDIKLSGLTSLEKLYCQENRLDRLRLNGLVRLYDVACYENDLSTNAINALYCSLPERGKPGSTINMWGASPTADWKARVMASNGWLFQFNNWDPRFKYWDATGHSNCGDDVQEFYLAPETLSGEVGETATLQTTIVPASALDKTITWSSSAEDIASVTQEGVVSFHRPGTATISAVTHDGGLTKTCEVYVYGTIRISPPSAAVSPGHGVQLTVEGVPEGDKSYLRLTNTDDFYLDGQHRLWCRPTTDLFLFAPKTQVIARSDLGYRGESYAYMDLSSGGSFELTRDEIWLDKNDDAWVYWVKCVASDDVLAITEIEIETDKTEVLALDLKPFVAYSTLKPIKAGEATVTLWRGDTPRDLLVHVVDVPLPDPVFDFPPITLAQGEQRKLAYSVTPKNTNSRNWMVKAVTFGNGKIASEANGLITGKSLGETSIELEMMSGVKVSSTVTVTPAVELTGLALEQNITMQEGTERSIAPTFTPEGTTQRTLSWFSDNPDVAAVDYQGRLYARKPGKATITALSWAKKLQATTTVRVTEHKLSAEEGGGEGGEEGGEEGGGEEGGDGDGEGGSGAVSTPVNGVQGDAPALSPNPVQDVLRLSGVKDDCQVRIYTPMGQLVYSGLLPEDGCVNVQGLSSGLYILRAGAAALRFVKE